jgi:hypothetical protein
MNSNSKNFVRFSLILCLLIAVGLDNTKAQEPSVSGVYTLIEVNGEKLPAVSWTKKSNGERCNEEISKGALFVDSEGRLAAFVTARDICLHEDGTETIVKEGSTIFPGSYMMSGKQLILQFELLPEDRNQAELDGDFLVVKDEGIGEYEGQSAEFVFRRQ